MFGALKFMFGYFPEEAEINKLADSKMREVDLLFNGEKLDGPMRKLTWFSIKEDVRREAQQRRTIAVLLWVITAEAAAGVGLGALVF